MTVDPARDHVDGNGGAKGPNGSCGAGKGVAAATLVANNTGGTASTVGAHLGATSAKVQQMGAVTC